MKHKEECEQHSKYIINELQRQIIELKSKNNKLFFGEIISELEKDLLFFLQLRRKFKNEKKSEYTQWRKPDVQHGG